MFSSLAFLAKGQSSLSQKNADDILPRSSNRKQTMFKMEKKNEKQILEIKETKSRWETRWLERWDSSDVKVILNVWKWQWVQAQQHMSNSIYIWGSLKMHTVHKNKIYVCPTKIYKASRCHTMKYMQIRATEISF